MPDARISAVILTRDEELNLPNALAGLEALGATVFIVDSGSTDRTVELARARGCKVFSHPFKNYSDQLNWALENLPLETEWVMRLDADEWLTRELIQELPTVLAAAPSNVSGYMLKRRVYFWGRWIRHGGYYPTWLLRVWRRGAARCEPLWMDEHMVIERGEVARLANDIVDENHKGLTFWIDKHNRYADREVQDLLATGGPDTSPLAGQARRRRWMKKNVYARAPLLGRAIAYWAMRYFIQGGFLDGVPGLVFHFLQGLWYRFLVDAKIIEQRRLAAGGHSKPKAAA